MTSTGKEGQGVNWAINGDGLAAMVGLLSVDINPVLTRWQVNISLGLTSVKNWGNQNVWAKHVLVRNIPGLAVLSEVIEGGAA